MQNRPSSQLAPSESGAVQSSVGSLHDSEQLPSPSAPGHGSPVCVEQLPAAHVSVPLQNSPSSHAEPLTSFAVQSSADSLHDSAQSPSPSGPGHGLPAPTHALPGSPEKVAILEERPSLGIGAPTVGWAAAAFDAMGQFRQPRFTANLRQPMVLVAAGRDEIVSTLATEEFGLRLRAGAHLIVNGAKHELLMEQDRYRSQFLAAFDAFVPGTPLFA